MSQVSEQFHAFTLDPRCLGCSACSVWLDSVRVSALFCSLACLFVRLFVLFVLLACLSVCSLSWLLARLFACLFACLVVSWLTCVGTSVLRVFFALWCVPGTSETASTTRAITPASSSFGSSCAYALRSVFYMYTGSFSLLVACRNCDTDCCCCCCCCCCVHSSQVLATLLLHRAWTRR